MLLIENEYVRGSMVPRSSLDICVRREAREADIRALCPGIVVVTRWPTGGNFDASVSSQADKRSACQFNQRFMGRDWTVINFSRTLRGKFSGNEN